MSTFFPYFDGSIFNKIVFWGKKGGFQGKEYLIHKKDMEKTQRERALFFDKL